MFIPIFAYLNLNEKFEININALNFLLEDIPSPERNNTYIYFTVFYFKNFSISECDYEVYNKNY